MLFLPENFLIEWMKIIMLEKKLNEMTPNEIQAADNIVQRTLDKLMSMYASVSCLFGSHA